MRHDLIVPLALMCFVLGCAKTTRPDAPVDAPVDAPIEEPDAERADYVLGVGELRDIEDHPLGVGPTYVDVQFGYAVFGVGERRALFGREPGLYEVTLPSTDSGSPRVFTLRVTDAEATEPGVPGEVFANLGVGQGIKVSGEDVMVGQALDPDGIQVRAWSSHLTLSATMRRAGRHDVVLWSKGGVRHLIFDVLPDGQLPEGAEIESLIVGGAAYTVDLTDVGSISLHDPEVVKIRVVGDGTAAVQPLGAGLTPVNIMPVEGEVRTIWFRVQPAE